MIQRSIDKSGQHFEALQRLEPPSVYLDHWALRIASRDRDVARRLTEAIAAREGTLVLSWASIGEFCNVDEATAEEAESLIEANLPRLFFSRFNPFDVIDTELSVYAGGPPVLPNADMQLLALVMDLPPTGIAPVTCRGMLTNVSGERSESMRQMRAAFVEKTLALRERYLDDREFRTFVDRSPRATPELRGTAIVLRELIAGLMRNEQLQLEPNDAMDFAHAVVPVAYCDYVLLDRRWRDQVDRLRTRLRRLEIDFPLAQALSGQDALTRLIDLLNATSSRT